LLVVQAWKACSGLALANSRAPGVLFWDCRPAAVAEDAGR